DYRAALRDRTGVGEYTHQLVRALLAAFPPETHDRPLDLTLFSSSWKDRLVPAEELAGAATVDRRVPVRVLNYAWHRLEWPPAEEIAGGAFDLTHSMHPLMLPSLNAARVVTICDLDFIEHPERTRGEIRRDYPALASSHARRADGVITISHFTAREIERQLGIDAGRIAVCPPGAPARAVRRGAPPRATLAERRVRAYRPRSDDDGRAGRRFGPRRAARGVG